MRKRGGFVLLVAIGLWRQEMTSIGKWMAFQDSSGCPGRAGKCAQGTGEGETHFL